MPRVVVVANLTARWLAEPGEMQEAVLRKRSGVEVLATTSRADLPIAAEAAAARRPDIVVLAGGDGSHGAGVGEVVRAFERRGMSPPTFALAPAGTTCTVARNWSFRGGGIASAGPRAAREHVERLLAAAASGEAFARVRERPCLRVTEDAAAPRLAFIVGAGLVARFFEAYEHEGADGYRKAARLVARIFGGSFVGGALASRVLEPVRCALDIDGAPAPFEAVSLFVASAVRDLGLSLHLTYRAGEELARFHVVASPLGARELGPQLPRVLARRPLSGPRVDALASRARLVFPPGEGAWVVDGDLLRGDAIVVEAGPALRIVDLDGLS